MIFACGMRLSSPRIGAPGLSPFAPACIVQHIRNWPPRDAFPYGRLRARRICPSIFRSTSNRSDNPYQAELMPSRPPRFEEPEGGWWVAGGPDRMTKSLGRDRAEVLERRQRSSERWEEYVYRFEMTALVGQDGIEMASQSGRSPSPYSTDEAFGASNIIRQMDNPVAARLKCEVVGRDTPAVQAGSPTDCRRTWDCGSDTVTGKVAHDSALHPTPSG